MDFFNLLDWEPIHFPSLIVAMVITVALLSPTTHVFLDALVLISSSVTLIFLFICLPLLVLHLLLRFLLAAIRATPPTISICLAIILLVCCTPIELLVPAAEPNPNRERLINPNPPGPLVVDLDQELAAIAVEVRLFRELLTHPAVVEAYGTNDLLLRALDFLASDLDGFVRPRPERLWRALHLLCRAYLAVWQGWRLVAARPGIGGLVLGALGLVRLVVCFGFGRAGVLERGVWEEDEDDEEWEGEWEGEWEWEDEEDEEGDREDEPGMLFVSRVVLVVRWVCSLGALWGLLRAPAGGWGRPTLGKLAVPAADLARLIGLVRDDGW